MATLHDNVAPKLLAPFVDPAGEWMRWWMQPMVDVQRMQWNALLGWQRSLATLNKDVWEQWAVRFGGGAPLDG